MKNIFNNQTLRNFFNKFAGKSTATSNLATTLDHYREWVDFGELIGYYIPANDITAKIPTTKGVIHHSKSGSHIIPANPQNQEDLVVDVSKLRLSGQRALWGIITPNVRKISICQEESSLLLCFYYDEDPTEMEIDSSEVAASEIIADFPEASLIDCERNVVNAPEKINNKGYLLYSRFES